MTEFTVSYALNYTQDLEKRPYVVVDDSALDRTNRMLWRENFAKRFGSIGDHEGPAIFRFELPPQYTDLPPTVQDEIARRELQDCLDYFVGMDPLFSIPLHDITVKRMPRIKSADQAIDILLASVGGR